MFLSVRRPNRPILEKPRPGAPAQSRRGRAALQALSALCALALASAALAQNRTETPQERARFEQAYADFKLGNYATALGEFEALAETGNAAAQYNLGFMRAKGLGAPADYVAAYLWFSLVARAGQERGANALAELKRAMSEREIAEGERRLGAFTPR